MYLISFSSISSKHILSIYPKTEVSTFLSERGTIFTLPVEPEVVKRIMGSSGPGLFSKRTGIYSPSRHSSTYITRKSGTSMDFISSKNERYLMEVMIISVDVWSRRGVTSCFVKRTLIGRAVFPNRNIPKRAAI